MGWEQGLETFFGSGPGAGVALIACIWMLIDIIAKVKK